MKHVSLLFAVLVVAVAGSGCYTMNAQVPGTIRNDVDTSQTQGVGRVEIEKTNWFFLYGLLNGPQPDFFSTELKQQVKAKGGDGLKNLTYEAQFGCVDLLVNYVTLGCVAPRTYKVSADIVKISAPRLPGKTVVGEAPKEKPDVERIAQNY